MFKNYLKVAYRNLWKNKAFSAINIAGLSAGLAISLLIVLYVKDELSYDKHNAQSENIYRIDADLSFNGTQFTSAMTPAPMGPTLKKDYPQVVQYTRLRNYGDILIKKDNQNIQNHNAVFADSTFFQVFSIPMISGNRLTALNEPNSIVIDESTAKKYFNSVDVLGKTLYVDNSTNCKITGVIKDLPPQSHFHFSYIRTMHDTWQDDQDDWLSNNYSTYLLVRPGVTQASLQTAVDGIVNKYLFKQLDQILHTSVSDLKKSGNHFMYPVMPLTDIHLHSNKSNEFEPNSNITYVYIFSIIAVFILLIACVNFMNLSTARSANRAKEVGVRKVAGSTRSALITQFLTESILTSFISMLVAMGMAVLLLPFFNQLAGKQLTVCTLFSTWLMPILVALIVVVGCLAGSYPALYLSSFQPAQVLKGSIAKGFKSSWLRSGLVIFQFFISVSLIIGTMVIYNQLTYIRSREIGYKRDQVMVINNANALDKNIRPFRQEMLKISGVENASITGSLPTETSYSTNGWFKDATLDAKQVNIMTDFYADQNYIPTLGMKIMSGRNFSKEFLSDSTAVIVNETAAKLLGFKSPLNENLYRPSGYSATHAFRSREYHIIGVVEDFNFNSMHDKVGPLVIEYNENWGKVALRINSKNIQSTISEVENQWKSMGADQPMNYSFLDADFNKIYYADQRTGKLFIAFAAFAIFIACLGLFGLVTYASEQRVKEIGVRKVLGASVTELVAMISKDFIKLVLIAFVIAFPVAWWMMNKWLEGFAYRIDISWWVFAFAGLLTIAIALITVSVQAIKAALTNPVTSLRSE